MARKKGQRARTPKPSAPKGDAPPSAPPPPPPPPLAPNPAADELAQSSPLTPLSDLPSEPVEPSAFGDRPEFDPTPEGFEHSSSVESPAVDVPGAPGVERPKFAAIAPREPVEVVVPEFAPAHESTIPAPVVVPSRPRRRGRKRSLLIGCGLFLAGVVTGGVIVAGWLADQRPAWWEAIDASNPNTVAIADAVENGAVDLLSQVRPSIQRSPGVLTSDPWTVKLTPEDVNAWIAVRMPKWIRNQSDNFRWPSEVAQLQVDFQDDDIVLGVRAQSHGVERYLWVTLDPMIDEDGALWLRATWVHVGRLSLPAGWFLPTEATGTTTVTKNIPDDIRALPATGTLLAALNGAAPVTKNPTVRLADGRRVRIVGVEAEGGALYVTCRTEVRQ